MTDSDNNNLTGLMGGIGAIAKLAVEAKLGKEIAGVVLGGLKDLAAPFKKAYADAAEAEKIYAAIRSAEARFRTSVVRINPDFDQLAASYSLFKNTNLQKAVASLPKSLDEAQLRATVKDVMEREWFTSARTRYSETELDAAAQIYSQELLLAIARIVRKLDEVNHILIQQLGDKLDEIDRQIEERHSELVSLLLTEFEKIQAQLKGTEIRLDKILQYIQGLFGVDSGTQVRKFIRFYYERPEQVVAFGGRNEALTALSDWLDDGDEQFCLMTAPAGRGKSALLVRWFESLVADKASGKRPDLELIFFPISIRFTTNDEGELLNGLIHPLRAILDDQQSLFGPAVVDRRDLLQKYLSWNGPLDKTILIVLDGIDEAERQVDWLRLFPESIHPNIKILASARVLESQTEDDWLRQLEWIGKPVRKMEVPPLSVQGLRDVLIEMGDPLDALAMRGDIVEPLHRLTEQGDPLLVELYVNRLLEKRKDLAGLSVAVLNSWPAGYEGFFKDWERDQEKLWANNNEQYPHDKISLFRNLLAFAKGPLRIVDIHLISKQGFDHDDVMVSRVAHAFRRFVYGDGLKDGYIFQHPKLAEYFRSQQRSSAEHFQQMFLDYGAGFFRIWQTRASNDVGLANRYRHAIQHYGAYLEEWGNADELYDLVSEDWLHAWLTLEKTIAGFMGDVSRAWKLAMNSPDPRLDIQVKAGMIFSTVRSQSVAVPKELLKRALEKEEISPIEAQVLIEQIPNIEIRVRTMLYVLELLSLGPSERNIRLVKLVELTEQILDHAARVSILIDISDLLEGSQQANVLAEAITVAHSIRFAKAKATALVAISDRLKGVLKVEALSHALDAARSIWSQADKAQTLIALSNYLKGKQRNKVVAESLEAVRSDWDATTRAWRFTDIADHLGGAQKLGVLAEALDNARIVNTFREETIAKIADRLENPQKSELLNEALSSARGIQDQEKRVRAVMALASRFEGNIKDEILLEALDATYSIKDKTSRAWLLTELSDQLEDELKSKVLLEALDEAYALQGDERRAWLLISLAGRLDGSQKLEALAEALNNALNLDRMDNRARVLLALAAQMHGAKKREVLAQALDTARSIHDETSRMRVLANLADHIEGSQILEALHAAQLIIISNHTRINVLAALSDYLEGTQKSDVLASALEITHFIPDEDVRAESFAKLASRLGGEQIAEALGVVRRIKSLTKRAMILTALANRLEGIQRSEVITEALEVACSIQDENTQADALVALANSLGSTHIAKALDTTRKIEPWKRVRVLAALANRLEGKQKLQILTEAVDSSRAINSTLYRVTCLSSIAQQLEDEHITEALTQALEDALAVKDKKERVLTLAILANHLEGELKIKALSQASIALHTINDHIDRAWALITLSELLKGTQRAEVLNEAFQLAREDISGPAQTRLLVELAQRFEGVQLQNLLDHACTHLDNELATQVIVNWGKQGIYDKSENLELLSRVISSFANIHLASYLDVVGSLSPVINDFASKDTVKLPFFIQRESRLKAWI